MPEQRNEINYEGQNIYVGIDVHLKSWSVTIMTQDLHHKTFNQVPDPVKLVDYLQSNFPKGSYYSAYEAGFCGFWAHYKLHSLNVNNIVVNPADVPTTQKEKMQKDDPMDSRKIARSLRSGVLKGIHVHEERILEDRALLRSRAAIVKDMVRFKQRIKAMLYFYGISYPKRFENSKTHWSKAFLNWLKEDVILNFKSGNDAFSLLVSEVEQQRKLLLEANRKVRELSSSLDYMENMRFLRSVPGIGAIVGMTFLTEIGDINRFLCTDKLAGYVGIIPSCHSSGEKDNKGKMTFRGQDSLLKNLIESAWTAARIDPALNLNFSKYCRTMEPNKAIIRITRKLLNRIYYVLKNKQEYVCCVVK